MDEILFPRPLMQALRAIRAQLMTAALIVIKK